MKKNLQTTTETAIGYDPLLGVVKVKDYKCPKCGLIHNDNENGYKVTGVKYPKIINERKGSTMDGSYWDWDELHKCQKCKTEYWFPNGAY